jgi:hypothetical protein
MTLSSSASAAILTTDSDKPKPMARDEALSLNSAPERHEPSKKFSGPDLSGFVGGADLWMVGKYER